MARINEPSIFNDRGNIGSSEELDEYGVWVKSGPQDLSLLNDDATDLPADFSGSDDIDLAIPSMDDDLADFDALELEASLSIDSGNVNSRNNTSDFDTSDISADLSSDVSFELPDIDSDTGTEEDNNGAVFNFGDLSESSDFESANFDPLSEDLSETDLSEPVLTDQGSAEPDSAESDSGEIIVDDVTEPSLEIEITETAGETDGFAEISFDELDADFNADISADISAESEPEVLELQKETASPLNLTAQSKASSSPDLSTQLLMKIADELASIRNELSSLKKEFSVIRSTSSHAETEESFNEEDDEKISLTGDELNDILITTDFTEDNTSDAGIELINDNEDQQMTADISLDIAADSDLDIAESEFSVENDFSIEIESSTETEISAETEVSADSILQFASPVITETIPDAIIPEETDDLHLSTADLDMEIVLDDVTPEDAAPDFAAADNDTLESIREKGAIPMTSAPAPEDTDYLVTDAVADADFSVAESDEDKSFNEALSSDEAKASLEDSIDLSGAVIDEPDLSADIHDNPIEEPAIEDISIDMELANLDSANQDSANQDSANLDFVELDSVELDFSCLDSSASQSPEPESVVLDTADIESADLQSTDSEQIEFEPLELDSSDLGSADFQSAELESSVVETIELDSEIPDSADLESNEIEPEEMAPMELDPIELYPVELESMESDTDVFESAESSPLNFASVNLQSDEVLPLELDSAVPESPDMESFDSTESTDSSESFDSAESLDSSLTELDTADITSGDITSTEIILEETETALSLSDVNKDTDLDADLSLIPEGFLEETPELLDFDSTELVFDELTSDESLSLREGGEEDVPKTDEGILEPIDVVEELDSVDTLPVPEKSVSDISAEAKEVSEIPSHLKKELKTVLSYMDQLLEALPDEKIEEFARSEYYDTYKKLFKELGLA